MLLSEFERATGIYPDSLLYEEIEREYADKKWEDKHDFCAAYKGNIDGLAEKIQRIANERIWKQDEKHRSAMAESSRRVEDLYRKCIELQEQLDKELEWKPSENAGTNLSEEKYLNLSNSAATDVMSEDLAKEYLYRNFGFAREMIMLVSEVCTFEVNRHKRLRVGARYKRKPLYCSSDYNYIRFDCAGNQWEIIDGELVPYYGY